MGIKKEENVGYDFQGSGLTVKEKNWAKARFDEYRKNYPHIHKMSDLSFLEELVFHEALHERIKAKLSNATKAKKSEQRDVIPKFHQDALQKSLDLQVKLKEKLGLFEDKSKLDAFRDFEELREDFREYRRRNPHMFKTTCPQCCFEYFLKRRTVDYEAIGTKWFKDKVLCNEELWMAYKEQKPLTKERMANILGVSEDQIDWLQEKIFTELSDVDPAEEPQLETLALPDDDSDETEASGE